MATIAQLSPLIDLLVEAVLREIDVETRKARPVGRAVQSLGQSGSEVATSAGLTRKFATGSPPKAREAAS